FVLSVGHGASPSLASSRNNQNKAGMQTRRIGPQSRFVPVMPQPLRSADPELRELRHRYNQLCARFAEVSDIDPISAANTVQELQELSDRIVAIEVRAEMAAREPRKTDAAGTG